MDITLKLPLETVNAALLALSKFPYEQSQPHIDLIRNQAAAQVAANEEGSTE
jgi:hypothetical protein